MQLQHLLFAPFRKNKSEAQNIPFEEAVEKELAVPKERTFRVENLSQEIKDGKTTPLKF